MMVTSKKSKIRLVLSTVLFMVVLVGVIVGFAVVFSILKATNETVYDGRAIASGSAVSGSDELKDISFNE